MQFTQLTLLAIPFAILTFSNSVSAEPVEQTQYGKAVFRLENRPDPQQMKDPVARQKFENEIAAGGFQARWISVVDPLGSPVYDSAFIPCLREDAAENEQILKDWVTDIHANGLPVVSWFPLILCESGAKTHPDWVQQFIVPESGGHTKGICCCINSPYGDALINMAVEAIERFNLDGFWFDGSAFTQIWDRPLPLSCDCSYCAAAFKKATGLEIPHAVNWQDTTFRRWVQWRYDMFGEYIGRLAAGIRTAHPHATVVLNNYHRPIIPWHGAIPLNPYTADIITGSEASGADRIDTTMRLCRAYGRTQSEVWRPFETAPENVETHPATDVLLQHALSCFVAGGYPSYGGGSDKTAETAALLSPILKTLQPYVGGASKAQVALHLSQQTETFHLSRVQTGANWSIEPFWASVETWTKTLGATHLSPDYIYDANLSPETLAQYKVVFLPMSTSLSAAQVDTLIGYAREGGLIVLGPAAGSRDEWGEPVAQNRLADALGFSWTTTPDDNMGPARYVTLTATSTGKDLSLMGFCTTLKLDDDWQADYKLDENPVIAHRDYGKGKVIAVGADFGERYSQWQAAADGDTAIAASDATTAQGDKSLKFTDGAQAAQEFYPDMEISFEKFAAPEMPGGHASWWLQADATSSAVVEMRSYTKPHLGPFIHVAPGGILKSGDKEIGKIPVDAWCKYEITFRFKTDDTPANYDLTVTLPDGAKLSYTDLSCSDADWNACDWAVVFGIGQEPAEFYLDDMSITPGFEPDTSPVFADNFETLQPGTTQHSNPLSEIIAVADVMVDTELKVQAPETVRVGFFAVEDGATLVHLQNRQGSHRDWQQAVGPEAKIISQLPVKFATLPISGTNLSVTEENGVWTITIPHVGVYEIVKIVM